LRRRKVIAQTGIRSVRRKMQIVSIENRMLISGVPLPGNRDRRARTRRTTRTKRAKRIRSRRPQSAELEAQKRRAEVE
jgi:hypothetical protein